VTGEATITTDSEGYNPLLHQAQFNLSSSRARSELSKRLTEIYPEADWDSVLERFCYLALQKIRQGEPVVELWSTGEGIESPKYLIHPILPLGKPTIIFGEGGVGKSIFALFLGLCTVLPWTDNSLGLTVGERAEVLYLDYETDQHEISWRMHCVKNGMDVPDLFLHYRRCSISISQELEQIQQAVGETGAKLVIVDSLGPACGGDLNSAETALSFFSAVRQLDTTTLIVAHTAKDTLVKHKSVFGSAFFHNLARSIWELRQVQEIGENEINIGLFHKKSNLSALHPPMGFRIAFDGDKTTLERQDMRDMDGLASQHSTKQRINDALIGGPMTLKEMSEELEMKQHSVEMAMYRMRDKGEIVKVDGKWGIAAIENINLLIEHSQDSLTGGYK